MPRHERREPAGDSLARLRHRLRAVAELHEPDRERMWARVEAALTEPDHLDPTALPKPRRRRGGVRIAASGLGTAAVVAASSLAVLTMTDRVGDTPALPLADGRSGVATPSRQPTPIASAQINGGPRPSDRQPPRSPRSQADPRSPKRSPESAAPGGLLTATGTRDPHSSQYWTQYNVTLRLNRPVTRLSVTIRVGLGGKATATGSWLSLPESDFEKTTRIAGNAIVYRFTLRERRQAWAGTWIFAAQFSTSGSHDADKDVFTVVAAAGGGAGVDTGGKF